MWGNIYRSRSRDRTYEGDILRSASRELAGLERKAEDDYAPFVTYMLGVIGACYVDLAARAELLLGAPSSEEVLKRFFDTSVGAASKRDILDANPGLSQRTVERLLRKLQEDGYIEKTGAARATRYRKRMH